jgi:GT2 family glycosyltransferase
MTTVPPIEMIGTMVLNGADDLWNHFSSIDHPLKRYVIIDNSMGKYPAVRGVIQQIQQEKPDHINEVVILQNNLNVGFSGSVNQLVRQNTDCPYWCIFSVDWHPRPGELAKLADRLTKPFTQFLCDETMSGYSAMVFKPQLIQKVGLMDENFFPAYFEDNDHRYRMELTGVSWDYFQMAFDHKVSSTLHSNRHFESKNSVTYHNNAMYYIRKWGGLPGNEQYESPFDSEAPASYWGYDPKRSEQQRWV